MLSMAAPERPLIAHIFPEVMRLFFPFPDPPYRPNRTGSRPLLVMNVICSTNTVPLSPVFLLATNPMNLYPFKSSLWIFSGPPSFTPCS